MDVSLLDLFTACVVVELELEDVNEALDDHDASLHRGQVKGYQARREELVAQLDVINAAIGEEVIECHNQAQELNKPGAAAKEDVSQLFTRRLS